MGRKFMGGTAKKAFALLTAVTMILSLLSGLTVTVSAYQAGDSFTIYSNPSSGKNTAGRAYIWATAPDATYSNNGDGIRAQFFHAGDGVMHEPNEGSLDGLNTKVIVTHRVAGVQLTHDKVEYCSHSDLAAEITYMENGEVKKSPAFRFTGFHYNNRQWKDCGADNTVTEFDLGTYPNVINVNVYHMLSGPLDGSTLIWHNSEPYHENVKFEVVGEAGEPIIPVDEYYIEKDVLPNADLGGSPATPAPTAAIPSEPGPTAEPLVAPGPIQDGPVIGLGLGLSFTLFPGEVKDVSTLIPNNGVIENAAPKLNAQNGVTRYELADGASVSHNIPWGINNTTLKGSKDSKVIFKPKEGTLNGVVTEVTAYNQVNGNAGLDAIVTYDGGKTETVNYLPDNFSWTERAKSFKIGAYPNLEYVTIMKRDTNEQRIPSLTFKVINEDVTSTESLVPEKKYEAPKIPTVTPKPVTTLPTPIEGSPLSINEVVASNETGFVDQNGMYSDWIELYNSSDADIDVSGYGLTDSVKKPYKWMFPAGSVVPAKGYLMVIASGTSAVVNGEIHAGFSISKSGETIMLSDLAGQVVSLMDLPALADDTAMARVEDGSENLRVVNPTPGESNNNAEVLSVVVPKPEFSAESGFYKDSFDLQISGQGGKVYYTIDGSEPTAQSPEFISPLTIYNRTSEPNVFSAITYPSSSHVPTVKVDKSMIVRAAVIDDEGNTSEVVTKTYFVGLDMMEDFNNTMVISMAGDGDDFFDENFGIFPNYEEQRREFEREVHLDIFDKDGSLVIDQNAGVRVRGFGYKGNAQKGVNLYARAEYGASRFEYPLFEDAFSKVDGSLIPSYKSVGLRHGSANQDGHRYADGVAQKLSGELDTAYQSQRPVILFLNGEYWGVYYMSERVSDDYIESYYGIPKEDVIVIKNHVNKGEAVEADRQLYHQERSWLERTDFTVPENYQQLTAKYDIENLMFFYASNINMRNRDWIGYNFATWRSRYITDRPYEDGKWRFMMYDLDTSFYEAFGMDGPLNASWGKALMSNPSLKKVFGNIILDSWNNVFGPQPGFWEMRYWYDEYYPIFNPKMRERWGGGFYVEDRILQTYGTWTSIEPEHIATFKQLFGLSGDYVPVNVRVNDPAMGNVQVNSIDHDFTKGSYSTRNFTDYTTTLIAKPNPGYKLLGWETSEGTTLTSDTDPVTYATLSKNGSRITAIFGFENDEIIEISNEAELLDMADKVNNQNAEYGYRRYALTNDIVLSGENNFTAIGTATSPFGGQFDGGNFTITGINMNTTEQGQGLFGYVGSSGRVKNVGVIDTTITSTGLTGKNVGGIVGNNKGTIENCFSTGTLSGISTVGGIVGNNSGGTVRNCYSVAVINSDSPTTLGGVAGKTEAGGIVANCYALIEPVAKNEGGSVDSLTAIKTQADFASGEVAYLLNSKGLKEVWGNTDSLPILANDTYKPVTLKVTFLEDDVEERYAYTFNGGTVKLPDPSVEWLYEGNPFTEQSIVTENVYVIRKGSVITPPTPTPEVTPTPVPTATPTPGPATPKPTAKPTATPSPTPAPTFDPANGFELWANHGNDFNDKAMGTTTIDKGVNADILDENGVRGDAMLYFNDGPDARVQLSGNDSSMTFYPTASLVNGIECDIIVDIFGEYGYPETEATVTYDGGQTDTFMMIAKNAADGQFYDKAGNKIRGGEAFAQKLPVSIGTYKSVESIKIRIVNSATKGSLGIWKAQFMKVGGSEPEEGITAIDTAAGKVNSVTITSADNAAGKLLVAIYTEVDGVKKLMDIRLIDITEANYTDGNASVPVGMDIPDGATDVKVFLWSSTENVQPLLDSGEVVL